MQRSSVSQNFIKLFWSLVLSFVTGFCLAAEPADSMDRELSVVTELSKLELALDARITDETVKGGDANLGSISQIEHEIMASSMGKRNLDVLSRILELKYSVLARETDATVVSSHKTDRLDVQSVSRPKTGVVSSGGTESDPPVLISISVDKVSVDVSQAPQTVTFTVEATDATGIGWDSSYVTLKDQGGTYHYAYSSSDTPGIFSIEIDSNDTGGAWDIKWLSITDTLGNKKVYSSLSSFGLPASIEIIGGVESDPPVLIAISVDKVSVDVSQAPQTVTFTVEATDATGIRWDSSNVTLKDQGGTYHYAYSSSDTPGIFSIEIDSNDTGGAWDIKWLSITDTLGNKKVYSSLSSFGLPASIEIIGGVESDPPVLIAISVDKVSVDVSQAPQTVTFTVEATDATGIRWDSSNVTLKDQGGTYHYAYSSSDTPGIFSIEIDSNDTVVHGILSGSVLQIH